MFKINNSEIGKYLSRLIKDQYSSDRRFCIEYLKLRDDRNDVENSDDIQKMQNRICQINKGNKRIQIDDLPIFSELLGVSIENILSAGTSTVPATNRKSNYLIAHSKDPDEWKSYIARDDKLILNPDEYNKTAIDYALECENYNFLRYLISEEYIWFVGNDEKEYCGAWDYKNQYFSSFGAGTKIERRKIGNHDALGSHMKEQADLRFKMISLAIKHKDIKMLDRLHAREFPMLYTITPFSPSILKNTKLPDSDDLNHMIRNIAAGENEILSYFLEEFQIMPAHRYFVFPYAGQVLDALIRQKRNSECKRFLKQAIHRNKQIQNKLEKLVDTAKTNIKHAYDDVYSDEIAEKEIWNQYYFYRDTGFFSYHTPPILKNNVKSFIANVIHITETSNDSEVKYLIDELNETYDIFVRYYEKKKA